MEEEELAYQPPDSENDKMLVRYEVYDYWRTWMIRSGAGQGISEACSEAWTPEDEESHDHYSDYEEHRYIMEASIPDLRAFYAMLIARGVAPAEMTRASNAGAVV